MSGKSRCDSLVNIPELIEVCVNCKSPTCTYGVCESYRQAHANYMKTRQNYDKRAQKRKKKVINSDEL